MPRRKRKGFTAAVPLSFVAIPAVGALAYSLRSSAAPSCALLHAPSRSSMIDSQLLSSRRFGERVRVMDEYPSVGNRRHRRHRDASAAQMTTVATPDQRPTERWTTSGETGVTVDTLEGELQQRQRRRPQHDSVAGVSVECRLRRELRKLGNLRQPQNVLELLAAAKGRGDPLSLRVFNAAVTAVAPCEQGCKFALRLLILMQEERIAPDRFTLTAIVASCLRCQKWDAAHGVLEKMELQGMQPLDLRPGRLTTAPGEAGEARDGVLRLLERLRSADLGPEEGLRPRDQLRKGGGSGGGDFTARDFRQGRVKSVVKATSGEGGKGARPSENHSRGTFRHVGTTAASSPAAADGDDKVGVLLAAETPRGEKVFLSELKAAANTKSWQRAINLLDGMREAGHAPHPGAYACAIRACGKAGKWEHSLALMDEMRSSGVEPGEGCNVMALKACADAGLWEKTLGMLKDMRASGVNRSESTFVVAMKACGDAGRWEEALAVMDDMRRDGIPPMETTYTTAMKACGSVGKWEQALKLFDEMKGIGIAPTEQCYTAAIRACAKADKARIAEKASSLLLKMCSAPGVSTNMSSFRAVMDAYCRTGDWASALRLLEDARRYQLKPNTADLRTMVEACGKAEQHERALSLLEEMRSEGMNLRRTGEKLWWVFNTCRDKKVKERAWVLMEVEQTRERVRLRAERNAQKEAAEEEAAAAAAAVPLRRTATTPTV
ncbi:unnamed protein product [Ectocarpus sp. 12 AP-2014]